MPRTAPFLPSSTTAVEPVRAIGVGGTARLWLAQHPLHGDVALKIVREELCGTLDAAALLAREHAVLHAVAHPRVVRSFGLVEWRGRPALVLEHLSGGDLVSLIGAPPRAWLGHASAVAAALAHVHACGFAYRDLKARNVLFDSAGSTRLVDFSSALPLGAPTPAGGTTAAYRPAVAPASAEAREDAVALAALLYELITSRLPFGPDGSGNRLGPPARPRTAPALAPLVDLMLETLADGGPTGSLSEFAAVIDTVAASVS